jgi:hypothetical protein
VIGDAPATIVWVSPEPPSAAESQAVSGWARAHGVRLAPPANPHPATLTVDLGVADVVEDLLDRARDAIAARDGEGVERATSTADALLRAHPELPQAAWLMAEVERTRATRWRRVPPEDVEAADRAWGRAAALDTGRVPGIGEVAPTARPVEALASLSLPRDDETFLDGRPTRGGRDGAGEPEPARSTTRSFATVAGPHALVVTAAGATVWAGWLELGPGSSSVVIDLPDPAPCSIADLSRAAASAGHSGSLTPVDARGVRCREWVAAAAGGANGTVQIARCEADRCAPAVEWPSVPAWARPAPPTLVDDTAARAHRWPAWATWALASAGAALAAGAVVVTSGALQPAPTATRFVTGGLKNQ